jgi:2-oxoacid:acceptor oxidoreductase delta subunit (pyruvate/2-ketoisovalerate family)
MPRWEELATGLVEFGPKVGERNNGFKTAFARTFRPVINEKKCIDCKTCHVFCPDGAIDYEPIRIDYEYCKGCGICSKVCGSRAITMPHELKVLEDLDEEEFLTIREALIEYAY